jgi:hypothetical protein
LGSRELKAGTTFALIDLANGSYYFGVDASHGELRSGVRSVPSTVDIGTPPTGGTTVTGNVQWTGTLSGSSPFVVILESTTTRLATRVTGTTSPLAFSVPAVPNGVYRAYFFKDDNADGVLSRFELNNFDRPAHIEVPGLVNTNLSFKAESVSANIATQTFIGTTTTEYSATMKIIPHVQGIVRATITSGPGISSPWDLGAKLGVWGFTKKYRNGELPVVDSTYQLELLMADGSVQTLSTSITNVLTQTTTPVFPRHTFPIPTTTPMFQWEVPEVAQASWTQRLTLWNNVGRENFWVSGSLPITTTTIPWNNDGRATGTMQTGRTYTWWIELFDPNGSSCVRTQLFSIL